MTGSQHFGMMKHVRETLAGRIGIAELYSLSQHEKSGILFDEPLDFSFEELKLRQAKIPSCDAPGIFEHIWRGGMPQVLDASEEMRQEYFKNIVIANDIESPISFNALSARSLTSSSMRKLTWEVATENIPDLKVFCESCLI